MQNLAGSGGFKYCSPIRRTGALFLRSSWEVVHGTETNAGSFWIVRWTYQAFEAIVAIVIFFIGVVMMIDGYRVGMDWAFDGPKGGYFPFRTGALISISSSCGFSEGDVG